MQANKAKCQRVISDSGQALAVIFAAAHEAALLLSGTPEQR